MARRTLVVFTAGVGAFALAVGVQTVLGTNVASASGLTNYQNCDEFLEQQRADLRARATAYGITGTGLDGSFGRGMSLGFPAAAGQAAEPMADGEFSQNLEVQASSGGAGTNLQEQGVDEPDLAKLADGRIVVITDNTFRVLSAGGSPQILGSLDLRGDRVPTGASFDGRSGYSQGSELLLVGNRAVVIQMTSRPVTVERTPVPTTAPPTTGAPTTAAPTATPTATPAPTTTDAPPTGPATEPPSTALPTTPGTAEPDAPPATEPLAPEGEGDAASSGVTSPDDTTQSSPAPDQGDRQIEATRVVLIDLAESTPRIIEERVQDGSYVSARLVDGTVRLVTRSLPTVQGVNAFDTGVLRDLLIAQPKGTTDSAKVEAEAILVNQRIADAAPLSAFLPEFTRTDSTGAVIEGGTAVSCEGVAHAATGLTGGVVTVTTMRPNVDLAAADTDAVATGGETIYAAPDRLYIATSRWPDAQFAAMGSPVLEAAAPVESGQSATPMAAPEVTTEIHSFDTSQSTSTSYVASGSVPGYIMGRWALSLHEGTLRVATTTEPNFGAFTPSADTANQSESMLVKLDESGDKLVETGRVEGLGKGERITAVRYYGDIASVVTFRQVDPLYLVDLSGAPKVMGELKIPGYSTYLHPIGDDLLLGVGYDGDENGMITGLQVSTFDVSDLSTPRLIERLPLADPGSIGRSEMSSPVIDDSRAFTYDSSRRELLLPLITFDWVRLNPQQPSVRAIKVDAAGGLSVAGEMPIEDLAIQGMDMNSVQRVLLDGDWFHAVGAGGVVTGTIDTMAAAGQNKWSETTP